MKIYKVGKISNHTSYEKVIWIFSGIDKILHTSGCKI